MRAPWALLGATLCLQVCGGCAASMNAIGDHPMPYGGVQNDFAWMGDPGFLPGFVWVLDIPSSLVLDSALLPFTVTDWLLRLASHSGGSDVPRESPPADPVEVDTKPSPRTTPEDRLPPESRDPPWPDQHLWETPSFSRPQTRGSLAD